MNVDYLLNYPYEDKQISYSERDSILYALAVGFGTDPFNPKELRFTYENPLSVLPSMVVTMGRPKLITHDPKTGIDKYKSLHGEQSLILHKPLASSGTLVAREKVLNVVDRGQGKGALLYTERRITDAITGELVATLNSMNFCRGNGGYGGAPGPIRKSHSVPDDIPDLVEEVRIPLNAGLLYRVIGDDPNPLHVDPDFAHNAGFENPPLHGLCTFGFAAHAILRACCDYARDPFRRMEVRFRSPVYPGDVLTFEYWKRGATISFRAFARARSVKVLDNGLVALT